MSYFLVLQVRGFNVRKWVAANRKRMPAVLASLGKLAAAGKLQIAMTECGPWHRAHDLK